jgi:hypothetical protein
MSTVRIALANVEFPATPEDSIRLSEDAIAQATGLLAKRHKPI